MELLAVVTQLIESGSATTARLPKSRKRNKTSARTEMTISAMRAMVDFGKPARAFGGLKWLGGLTSEVGSVTLGVSTLGAPQLAQNLLDDMSCPQFTQYMFTPFSLNTIGLTA